MAQSADVQLKTMIDNMPEKTGNSIEEWKEILSSAGCVNHAEIMNLLKNEYGVTHGFANTISALYRQWLEGGPKSNEELVDQQFSGKKANLRETYEAILDIVTEFGTDVKIAPKKTYISLRRNKQFAIVKAATATRIDLGLNLKDVEVSERLEEGKIFGGMCTHRVRITAKDDVDNEVVVWLKKAYEES